MLFSIVLRTKNEIKNIEKFYKSVLHQTYKNYELIVIDNFFSDGTYEYCIKNNIKIFPEGTRKNCTRKLWNVRKIKRRYSRLF